MAVGNGAERGAKNGGGGAGDRGGLLRRGSDDVAVERIARDSSGLFGVIALNSKNRMQALECRMKSQTHTNAGRRGKKGCG